MVVGPPSGSPNEIISKLHEIFTIKGGGEPIYHLGCDYVKKPLCLQDRSSKQVDKLRQINYQEDNPITKVVVGAMVKTPPEFKNDYWLIRTRT